jgi:hypothetical protein
LDPKKQEHFLGAQIARSQVHPSRECMSRVSQTPPFFSHT